MIVNLIVSILAGAVILERFFMLLTRLTADGKNFMQNIERYVLANDLTQAINYCNTSQAPLATVVKAGLVKANRGGMAISMGVDEALLQVTPLVEKRIGTLWSFANIATLIGLIGTIVGLITAFTGLSVATPEQRALLLGSGIAEALYNTAFGLVIAVSCIMSHLFLSGIAKKIIGDLDYYSSRLENLLTLRQDAEKA
ncbi:MAG TPA: MotA/TolQ/ExbB proton channel family protein [Bdellovibrionota bacterium]|nr:MotA/TolQ/ExbB proton channel family protein [Bdellovibrionota bacterium]